MTIKKILTYNSTEDVAQPDDEALDESFPDPRMRRAVLQAFRSQQNEIIDLQNTVNGTNIQHRTMAQIRAWFRAKLKA